MAVRVAKDKGSFFNAIKYEGMTNGSNSNSDIIHDKFGDYGIT